MVFSGTNPSEDREMRHGIRETIQMAPGRVGPVLTETPMRGSAAPTADHAAPGAGTDPAAAPSPQPPDHAGRPEDPDMEYAAAASAANLAVEGVEDVTRYGLTIPFTRWLLAYKAGLAAEDFAISTREDLERAERERASETPPTAPGVPTDGNPDPTPTAAPPVETPSDTAEEDAAAEDVPPAPGNEEDPGDAPEPTDGESDGDDVLSIPESREIGDDQAEREALIGQFGARTQMRDTYYPNLASFVELHVANMWPYQQGVMTKFLWVPDWWRYPPLIYQLDALWRAYENARRQPGQMMIFNIQAFGLLDRVFNKDTGLVASLGIAENEHTTGPGEPLPCERPPKGWRRKAMEPLRPVRPKEMEEAAAVIPDRERPPRRPNMKLRAIGRNQQEGGR